MRFQIPLKGKCTVAAGECGIALEPPLPAVFARMRGLPDIVLEQAAVDVVGQANVPMQAIAGFQDVHVLHGYMMKSPAPLRYAAASGFVRPPRFAATDPSRRSSVQQRNEAGWWS